MDAAAKGATRRVRCISSCLLLLSWGLNVRGRGQSVSRVGVSCGPAVALKYLYILSAPHAPELVEPIHDGKKTPEHRGSGDVGGQVAHTSVHVDIVDQLWPVEPINAHFLHLPNNHLDGQAGGVRTPSFH